MKAGDPGSKLAGIRRQIELERCRTLLGLATPEEGEEQSCKDDGIWQDRLLRLAGIDPTICPTCGRGRRVLLQILLMLRR